jgi:hypothetical protein
LIGETASCNNYGSNGFSPDQVGYISDMETQLDSGAYPQIRGLMYFDSFNSSYFFLGPHGVPNPVDVNCDWTFGTSIVSPDSISGITAFSNLALDPTFAPTVLEP